MSASIPRVLITRRLPETVEARIAARYETVLNPGDTALDSAALARAMIEYDAIVPTITDRIDAALLSMPDARVKMIANFGAGVEHIDLNAAKVAGIAVSNTPGALTEATAELAITLMLMASRRAGEGEREVRAGRWTGWRPTHLVGQGLSGKTLGLVGFGRIAQATAARACALGMGIRYHSRTPAAAELEAEYSATRDETLEVLAASSDVLSVHVPGGAQTRHLIDARILRVMRPSAILINTARGPVVDEDALAAALAKGEISGAGLDVYEQEPRVHPELLASERAVLLPHLGSATIEARTAMGMQAADNLDAFFLGQTCPNRVA